MGMSTLAISSTSNNHFSASRMNSATLMATVPSTTVGGASRQSPTNPLDSPTVTLSSSELASSSTSGATVSDYRPHAQSSTFAIASLGSSSSSSSNMNNTIETVEQREKLGLISRAPANRVDDGDTEASTVSGVSEKSCLREELNDNSMLIPTSSSPSTALEKQNDEEERNKQEKSRQNSDEMAVDENPDTTQYMDIQRPECAKNSNEHEAPPQKSCANCAESCRQFHDELKSTMNQMAEKLSQLVGRVDQLFEERAATNARPGSSCSISSSVFGEMANVASAVLPFTALMNTRVMHKTRKSLSPITNASPTNSDAAENAFTQSAPAKVIKIDASPSTKSPSPTSQSPLSAVSQMAVSECGADFEFHSGTTTSTTLSGSKKRKPTRDTVHKVPSFVQQQQKQMFHANNNSNNNNNSNMEELKEFAKLATISTMSNGSALNESSPVNENIPQSQAKSNKIQQHSLQSTVATMNALKGLSALQQMTPDVNHNHQRFADDLKPELITQTKSGTKAAKGHNSLEPLFASLFQNNFYSALLQHHQRQQQQNRPQQQVQIQPVYGANGAANQENGNENCSRNAGNAASNLLENFAGGFNTKFSGAPTVPPSPSSSCSVAATATAAAMNGATIFFGDDYAKLQEQCGNDASPGGGGGSGGAGAMNSSTARCSNCNTMKTTAWRRDKAGKLVCNACGLYFRLHRTNRPVHMRKDFIQQRYRRKNASIAKDEEMMAAAGGTTDLGLHHANNNNNKSPSPPQQQHHNQQQLPSPLSATLGMAMNGCTPDATIQNAGVGNGVFDSTSIRSLSSLISANSHLFVENNRNASGLFNAITNDTEKEIKSE